MIPPKLDLCKCYWVIEAVKLNPSEIVAEPSLWVTPVQLSDEIGISVDRLRHLRYNRQIFPFYKIPGVKIALYKRSEVNAIIEGGRVDVS